MTISAKEVSYVEAVLSVRLLKHCQYNPEVRTDDENSNYRKLRRSIVDTGGILVPIDVAPLNDGTGQYTVPNGNQRLAISRELGYDTIKARIWSHNPIFGNKKATVQELAAWLYGPLNTAAAITARQAYEVAERGGPVMDSKTQNALNHMSRIFGGLDRVPTMLKGKVGPGLLNESRSCYKYCWSGIKQTATQEDANIAKILLWMVRNNTQQPVRTYKKKGYDRDALRSTIENNRPKVPRV
jgi:hypothetical protein